jgi:hypothetical protein
MIALWTPIEIESRLSPEECAQRLHAITLSPFAMFKFLSPSNRLPFAGRVKPVACSLRYRIGYRNSFQRRLDLAFVSTAAGTSLVGKLALPLYTMGCCFLWMFVVFRMMFWHRESPGQHLGNGFDYIVPLGLLAFMTVFVAFGLWLSSLTEKKLLEAVTHAVSGRLIPQPTR